MAKSLSVKSFQENLVNGKYSKSDLQSMKTNLINNYSKLNQEKIDYINAYLIGLDKLNERDLPTGYEPIQEVEKMTTTQTVITDDDLVNKYCQLKESARSRDLEFSLVLKDIKKLLTKKTCYYTGIPFGVNQLRRTIDRIDNTKGYISGNVVACTYAANQFKEQVFESKVTASFKGNLKVIKKIISVLEAV